LINQSRLSQGTIVLSEKVDFTETVSIGFWLLTGSRDEDKTEQGLTHFLEHMVFKGSETRSAFLIAQEIDRVGGILNAFTEKEHTCFYCTLPSEYCNLAIDVISDMLFNPVFAPQELEKEKKVIISEIQSIDDSPEEIAYDSFLENLWAAHPLARKITGTTFDIQNINRDKLREFHQNRCTPKNLLISLAGKFELSEVLDQLESSIPQNSSALYVPERTVPVPRKSWKYMSGHFSQVHVFTGFSFPLPEKIEELYQFLIFSTLFGESMSSRLFQRIREEKGICYSIFSMRSFFTSIALWKIYAGTAPENLDELITGLNTEIQKIYKADITNTEVENAITHLVGCILISKDDMEVRMKRLFRHFILGGEIHDIPTTIKMLESVTSEDIERFIHNHLLNNAFNLLAFGTKRLNRKKKLYFTL